MDLATAGAILSAIGAIISLVELGNKLASFFKKGKARLQPKVYLNVVLASLWITHTLFLVH